MISRREQGQHLAEVAAAAVPELPDVLDAGERIAGIAADGEDVLMHRAAQERAGDLGLDHLFPGAVIERKRRAGVGFAINHGGGSLRTYPPTIVGGGGQRRLMRDRRDNQPKMGYRFFNTPLRASVPASDPRGSGAPPGCLGGPMVDRGRTPDAGRQEAG